MKKLVLKLKKIKKCLSNLYNIDQKIKQNLYIMDYEKDLLNKEYDKNLLIYDKNQKEQIIVSLTTYNKRIYDVHLTIESIFRQTVLPNKIILWLAEDEFNEDNIPIILKKMKSKGLEIEFCKDLKSYKKLIPALKKYPEDLIITIDDDIIYSYDLIEKLYKEYLCNQNKVICSRAHRYKIQNKKFDYYNNWEMEAINIEKQIFLTTGGGTLFPPKCFSKDDLKEEIIFKLTPKADDVWVNAILMKNGIEIKQISDLRKWSDKNMVLSFNQDIGLSKLNVEGNQNDIQLKAIFDYYNLWEKLKG